MKKWYQLDRQRVVWLTWTLGLTALALLGFSMTRSVQSLLDVWGCLMVVSASAALGLAALGIHLWGKFL